MPGSRLRWYRMRALAPSPRSIPRMEANAMERTLLYVEPAEDRWQIVLDNKVLASHDARHAAIDMAMHFARNRHEVTGEPTGVVAPICNGEVVLLDECG